MSIKKRIKLTGGHSVINIEGTPYEADETGAFLIPEEYCDNLIRIHGGEYEPGVEILAARAQQADELVASTKNLLNLQIESAKQAHAAVEEFKRKQQGAPLKVDPVVAANANKQSQQNNNQQRR